MIPCLLQSATPLQTRSLWSMRLPARSCAAPTINTFLDRLIQVDLITAATKVTQSCRKTHVQSQKLILIPSFMCPVKKRIVCAQVSWQKSVKHFDANSVIWWLEKKLHVFFFLISRSFLLWCSKRRVRGQWGDGWKMGKPDVSGPTDGCLAHLRVVLEAGKGRSLKLGWHKLFLFLVVFSLNFLFDLSLSFRGHICWWHFPKRL